MFVMPDVTHHFAHTYEYGFWSAPLFLVCIRPRSPKANVCSAALSIQGCLSNANCVVYAVFPVARFDEIVRLLSTHMCMSTVALIKNGKQIAYNCTKLHMILLAHCSK